MAKTTGIVKTLLPIGLLIAAGFGIKKLFDVKNGIKYLRVGLSNANGFSYNSALNSVDFNLVLLLQNLGDFSISVKEFVGKAYVNAKDFGVVTSTSPITITPKSDSKASLKLSIPVQNLIREAGFSLLQILGKAKNKKMLKTPIVFEGVLTLSNGIKVPVNQTISI